jgi:DNA-binding transcriptional LysR family regulator
VLRIGLSSTCAIREIIPRLPKFMDRHPLLRIDLVIDDERQDLVTEGVDVALRFGTLSDSTAIAQRIAAWPRMLVASPDYLAKARIPKTPAAVSVQTSTARASPPYQWVTESTGSNGSADP